MTEQDRPDFATLMLGLGETYGEPVSDARMEIYFSALADLELADVRRSATVVVRTSKFFPRPAELREGIDGSSEDRAELAWMRVIGLVRSVGYMGMDGKGTAPDFDGDIACRRAALQLYGGWSQLCSNLPANGPELLGWAKQFKAAYRAYDNRSQRQLLTEHEGHELSAADAVAALSRVKLALVARGLPTHDHTEKKPGRVTP